jgi:hypothetical protein
MLRKTILVALLCFMASSALAAVVLAAQQAIADSTIAPPTELPPIVKTWLGVLAPIVAQFVVNRFKSRVKRFGISLLLTGLTGAASFYLVRPGTTDFVDFMIYFYAWASISYQAVWRSLWDSNLPLPRFIQRKEGGVA